MDITTLNDRHLYRATVTLSDPEAPDGRVEVPSCVVRLGPSGWLTLADAADGHGVRLFPTWRVVALAHLREAGPPGEPG